MTSVRPRAPDVLARAGHEWPRLLIFVVAYNAERTIEDVLGRIPPALADECDVEVLIIDDSSQDRTFERSERARATSAIPFVLHVLYNPVNQGYGGNQKIGFHFAIRREFDYVVLLHGDGQYAPECLPDLVQPLVEDEADAVLGSRILGGGALAGGMPLYKFVGNRILTAYQNRLLRTRISEFHTGYRAYRVSSLSRVPFDLNTNDFHFDSEIIIQLLSSGARIGEVPIPTHYGDEPCHVDGLRYAWDVAKTTARARVQELNLLYDRKYDVRSETIRERSEPKLGFLSPQTLTLDIVPPGARVLDLGCAGGFLGAELRARGCYVAGIDTAPLADGVELDEFHLHDLDDPNLPFDPAEFDYVLLLDVVEHLTRPEEVMDRLRVAMSRAPDARLVLSTANVAFALTRVMLAAGQFNYSKRGILDLTHTRLFTVGTIHRLLEGAWFETLVVRGVPAPIPLALGNGKAARAIFAVNRAAARVRKSLFAYQIFIVARPRPSLDRLLADAEQVSRPRSAV